MTTDEQLAAIAELVTATDVAGIGIWLRGGWAVDFFLGRLTRDHADIDLYLSIDDVEELSELVEGLGYTEITTAPPEQQRDFDRMGVEISFALIRVLDGKAVVAGGPFEGEEWPVEMFNGPIGELAGVRCRVTRPEEQIEIKEMTPVWIPRRPRRQKDQDDIVLLREALRSEKND